jgi:ribosomal protein L1
LIENIHIAVQAIADVIGKTPELTVERMHLAPTMGPSVKVVYSKE